MVLRGVLNIKDGKILFDFLMKFGFESWFNVNASENHGVGVGLNANASENIGVGLNVNPTENSGGVAV